MSLLLCFPVLFFLSLPGLVFRKIIHPQSPLTFPLISNVVLLVNNVQKVECLASHIHTVLGSPDLIPPLVLPPSHGHTISTAITPQELSSALQALSVGKVTGPNNVPNEFLRCFPDLLVLLLLNVFNASWVSGTFLSVWRHAITIPIFKPGKNPSKASSYRPISLLSNFSKVLEHIVHDRLTWWLEHKNLPLTCLAFVLTGASWMPCSS